MLFLAVVMDLVLPDETEVPSIAEIIYLFFKTRDAYYNMFIYSTKILSHSRQGHVIPKALLNGQIKTRMKGTRST